MFPSLIFLLFATVLARQHHHRIRRAQVPDVSVSSLPSPSSLLPSSSISLATPLSSSSLVPSSLSSPSSSSPTVSTSSPTSPSFSASSQTPVAIVSSSAPSSSTSSLSSPSSTSVSSISSTSSAPLVVVQSLPTSSSTPITSLDGASTPTGPSSTLVYLTSTPATPSSASTSTHPSSSGFFSNPGAVGATFTVVGLVGVAAVIAVVLLVAKRRHSRAYDEDTEYLDKVPDHPADPPITQVTSLDETSASDHAHYGAPPMALTTPPTTYYPEHAFPLQPQAFSPEAHPTQAQPAYPAHPVASTQDYPPQRMYFPEDYDIAYPPTSRGGANMHNPREFTNVELDSTPVPQTRTVPGALRPSAPSAPKQSPGTRFSVDSFYAGIATDTQPSNGHTF